MNMSLQFFGDWSIWMGIPAALLAGAATWFFYKREVKARQDRLRWLLPLLRSAVVFFLVLMLTGPVIHHRKTIGQFARVLLFVDASRSMSIIDDEAMSPSRKLLTAVRLGWIPPDLLPKELADFETALMEAQQASAAGVNRGPNNPLDLRRATNDTLASVKDAHAVLQKIPPESLTGLAPRGSALMQYWEEVDGGSINNLKRAKGFPDNPDGTDRLRMLEGRRNWKDKYGAKISGYLYAPLSGNYTFFLVANEEAEFYLSKDS
ncbi:MAG: hypothetical protein ACOCVL_03755, partial [Candidatus Sumerlaeota bacterium]